jgi:hypothetical protein
MASAMRCGRADPMREGVMAVARRRCVVPLCPSCSHEVPEGDAFCSYCGARVIGADPTQTPPERHPVTGDWTCPRCSVENTADSRFCFACGTPRPATAEPSGAGPSAAVTAATMTASGAPSHVDPLGRAASPGPSASRGPVAPPSRGSRGLLMIALVLAIVAVAAVAALVFVDRRGSGDATQAPVAAATAVAPTPATTSQAPGAQATQSSSSATWRGIDAPVATPFWAAFYCAGHDQAKAIQAAQVGHAAGWSTLVLKSTQYASLDRAGPWWWLVCAGPFSSEAEAKRSAQRMKADAKELRASAPQLDIKFGTAYAKLVK